jgi:hypothetical protein
VDEDEEEEEKGGDTVMYIGLEQVFITTTS